MDLQSLFIPLLIVLFAIPLVLQARKQKRTMQEQQKLQNSLGVGDRVMTTSGLFGTVVGTAEDNIDLEVAPGVTTTWLRQAIREKVDTQTADESQTAESQTAAESGSADQSQTAAESGSNQQASAAEASQSAAEPQSSASSDATSSGASSESGAQVAEPIEQQKTT